MAFEIFIFSFFVCTIVWLFFIPDIYDFCDLFYGLFCYWSLGEIFQSPSLSMILPVSFS